jgi:Mor family transcriptional regulator
VNNDTQLLVDGLLGQLIELIGLGWTLRLCQDFGGTEVYFPKRINADHPIAKSVGLDVARALADFAGQRNSGGTLDVPRGVVFNSQRRNSQILKDLENGLSKKEIARRYGLTTRWVRHLCNSSDDDRQASLFD